MADARGQMFKAAARELVWSKAFQNRFAKFLVHPVTILAFATVAAVCLTNYYQHKAWIKEKRFEVFRQWYEDSVELVDELSEVMSRRAFGLNRIVWAAKGTGTGKLDEVWDEYYESVVDWNTKHMGYRGRLVRAFGYEAAVAFGAWQDVARNPTKGSNRSIHGHFFVAHQHVRELVDCVRKRCSSEDKLATLKRAEETLNELGTAMERFINTCTGIIQAEIGAS